MTSSANAASSVIMIACAAVSCSAWLSKSAAIQCAADQVRVNSIHPGFVDTPMTASAHANNALASERMNATPLGRFGTPYDIAMGCVYLASDEAAWVTGAELVIDGGVVAS